jgi:cytochrome P450
MSSSPLGETRSGCPVAHFDHHDIDMAADKRRAQYDELRNACPVSTVDAYGGFYLVNGYNVVREVVTKNAQFISGDGIFLPPSGLPPVAALEFDGEEHAMWRALMNELLSPSAVKELEPMVGDVVDSQISSFASRGKVDLVSDFAHPVPGIVIGRLVGLDQQDSLRSQELAETMFAAIGTPGFESALGAFAEFTLARLHDRRAHPTGDVLSQLASGSFCGVSFDDGTAFQLFVALLGGGFHSTASGISGFLHHVLSNPTVKEQVTASTKDLARGIDESLRLTTPLQLFARTATEDVQLESATVANGSRVLVNYAAANRDPSVFDAPSEFRLDRRRNPHVAFGGGAHVCVGQHLARLEMRTALTQLLTRLPDITLTAGVEFSGLISGQLMNIVHMPASFTPEA